MSKTYYKVLKGDQSNHGGNFTWSLPTKNEVGEWVAGDWHEVSGELALCRNGLHLTDTPSRWWFVDASCYVAETEGSTVDDGGDKVAAKKVRLIRQLSHEDLKELGIFVLTEGEHEVGAGHVYVSGSASVTAYGSASVEAYDSASVEAYGSASVKAYDSASVEAYGSASVRAYGSASVTASGSASVEASGQSLIVVRKKYWANGENVKVTLAESAVSVDYRGDKPVTKVAE